jgi:hypothetical protein
VTVPFWLYDPQGFSPLSNQSKKVAVFQATLPHAGFLIPLLGACVALLLSFERMNKESTGWLRSCAIVQALMAACVVILSTAQAGKPFAVMGTGFEVFFLFFGAYAFGAGLFPAGMRAQG